MYKYMPLQADPTTTTIQKYCIQTCMIIQAPDKPFLVYLHQGSGPGVEAKP